MEYCEGGDLYKWRLDNIGQDGLLDENLMVEMLRQIAEGLDYLHGKNLGHRDIDPRNILLKDGIIKIVDFGLSFNIDTRSKPANSKLGKDLYAAPEVLQGIDYSPSKADVFSYGCVMFYLSTGDDAYKGIALSSHSKMKKLKDVKINKMYSSTYKKLMVQCLQENSE